MLKSADKRFVEIEGMAIAYRDLGSGDPIIFLHGNQTSSFLWRNIIPHLQSLGRCIGPDLIGMGDFEKLPNSGPDSYTFVEHRRYLDGFFDALALKERVTLVVHDWGSALGFDWAKRNPNAVKGIVHMEAIVATMNWDDIPAPVQPRFRSVRSAEGEELVLQSAPRLLPGCKDCETRGNATTCGRRDTKKGVRKMYLVTGATGDVGRIVVAELLNAGQTVRLSVRDRGSGRQRLIAAAKSEGDPKVAFLSTFLVTQDVPRLSRYQAVNCFAPLTSPRRGGCSIALAARRRNTYIWTPESGSIKDHVASLAYQSPSFYTHVSTLDRERGPSSGSTRHHWRSRHGCARRSRSGRRSDRHQ